MWAEPREQASGEVNVLSVLLITLLYTSQHVAQKVKGRVSCLQCFPWKRIQLWEDGGCRGRRKSHKVGILASGKAVFLLSLTNAIILLRNTNLNIEFGLMLS